MDDTATRRRPALRVRITKAGYTILCRSRKVGQGAWRESAEAFASGWYGQPMRMHGDRFLTIPAYEMVEKRMAFYATLARAASA